MKTFLIFVAFIGYLIVFLAIRNDHKQIELRCAYIQKMIEIQSRNIKENYEYQCEKLKCIDNNFSMLAPESVVSKKYHYEVRCTCGLLFRVKETPYADREGTISHTTCYDCFMKANPYDDRISYKFKVKLFKRTVLAKERAVERCA